MIFLNSTKEHWVTLYNYPNIPNLRVFNGIWYDVGIQPTTRISLLYISDIRISFMIYRDNLLANVEWSN